MKRKSLIAFCLLMLCSSFLIVNVATVKASAAGYSMTEAYQATGVAALDGKWTSSAEWSDAWINVNVGGTKAIFAYKMDATSSSGAYLMSFLLESPDNTNDATDKWTILIDGAADGGTAPQTDDIKIEITGHTTKAVYAGTGTTWANASTAQANAVTWKDSLTTSPSNSAQHYVLELQADKATLGAWGANPPPEGVAVQMYDASTPSVTIGWPPVPPASSTVPNGWGLIADYTGTLPESLSFGLIALLSSAAMIAGFFGLRKRKISKLVP